MHIIVQGVILGFTLSMLFGFGPALLALVQTSIHRGFWSGVLLATGVFVSDIVLVGLSFLGAIKILDDPGNKMIFGIAGGILLAGPSPHREYSLPRYSAGGSSTARPWRARAGRNRTSSPW